MVTARDAAHKFMIENWPDWVSPILKNGAIYHCGPVIKKDAAGYHAVSAGPTTSIREEPYEHRIIANYLPRVIIGKGGMGDATLGAMKAHGAIYVHAIGGAASVIAATIKHIKAVHMLDELGPPEAFWEMEVTDFSGIVTMDAHGNSLHDEIFTSSKAKFDVLV